MAPAGGCSHTGTVAMTDTYEINTLIERWRKPRGRRAVAAVLFIALFIALVGVLVYATGGTSFVWLNTMYFPIILAAAAYRMPGGAAAALAGSLVVGPFMPLDVHTGIPQDCANWLMRGGVFMLVGAVTGLLFTWIDRQYDSLRQAYDQLAFSHEELRKTQLELIQAEKLESLGRLAAGVAHEVKNPLAVLQLGIDYLAISGGGDKAAAETIEEMDEAIKKADRVIKGLVDYSRFEELDLKTQPLNPIIEEALNLVKHEIIKEHIIVASRLSPEIPPVPVDRGKIQQVFINLFINGTHAVEGGGKLTVVTSQSLLTEGAFDGFSPPLTRFAPGDSVVIADIFDTGTGVPEDKIGKLFDPFFTTKPVGKGTGLGLSVCYKIMELHTGWIGIKNRKDGGAQVTILLKPEKRDVSA
jgi:signal transduction histidine kinase